jgi:hypothetical protein
VQKYSGHIVPQIGKVADADWRISRMAGGRLHVFCWIGYQPGLHVPPPDEE